MLPNELERGWFQKLMALVPQHLRSSACVAGGFAADVTRAHDVDVWVLSSEDHDPKQNALALLNYSNGFSLPDVNDPDYVLHHLVCTIPKAFHGLDVQLLVTPARTMEELVNSFDISTHAVAMRQDGEAMKVEFADKWTTRKQQPRVMRFTTPESTLGRLMKIADRYETTPNTDDIMELRKQFDPAWKVAA